MPNSTAFLWPKHPIVIGKVHVCQNCGDKGDLKQLVFCIICKTAANHRYCLDTYPKSDAEEATWTCEECSLEDVKPNVVASRKSERICFRKEVKLNMVSARKIKKTCFSITANNKLMGDLFLTNDNRSEAEGVQKRRLALQDKDSSDDSSGLDELEEPKEKPSLCNQYQEFQRRKRRRLLLDDEDLKSVQVETNDEPCNQDKGSSDDSSGLDELEEPKEKPSSCSHQELQRQKRRLLLDDDDLKFVHVETKDEPCNAQKKSSDVEDGAIYSSGDEVEAEDKHVCDQILGNGEFVGGKRSLHHEESRRVHDIEAKDEPYCNKGVRNQENREHKTCDESKPVEVEAKSQPSWCQGLGNEEFRGKRTYSEPKPVEVQASHSPDQATYPGSLTKAWNQPSLQPATYFQARPVQNPIWRGQFRVQTTNSSRIVEILSHVSNKASAKVLHAAGELPSLLDFQMLHRFNVWPKSFQISLPTSDSIGLYFISHPQCKRDDESFDQLLNKMYEDDLALKAVINNVELLVFPSFILPPKDRCFYGKYYLWGVYRPKLDLTKLEPTNNLLQNANLETIPDLKLAKDPKVLEARDHPKNMQTQSLANHLRNSSSYYQSSKISEDYFLTKGSISIDDSFPFRKEKNYLEKNKKKLNGKAMKKGQCFYCGKEGHWKRNCAEYLAPLKKVYFEEKQHSKGKRPYLHCGR